MARRDGTGPMGQGSMTGRGLGTCTKEAANLESRVEVKDENVDMSQRRFGLGRGQAGLGRGQVGLGRGGRGRACRGARNFGPRCQRGF